MVISLLCSGPSANTLCQRLDSCYSVFKPATIRNNEGNGWKSPDILEKGGCFDLEKAYLSDLLHLSYPSPVEYRSFVSQYECSGLVFLLS